MKLYCCNYRLDENVVLGEAVDKSAENLSHVGEAAYNALRLKHFWYHHRCWNVTSGKIVGELHATPKTGWISTTDPPAGNDDWFPAKIGEIIAKTEVWCKYLCDAPAPARRTYSLFSSPYRRHSLAWTTRWTVSRGDEEGFRRYCQPFSSV